MDPLLTLRFISKPILAAGLSISSGDAIFSGVACTWQSISTIVSSSPATNVAMSTHQGEVRSSDRALPPAHRKTHFGRCPQLQNTQSQIITPSRAYTNLEFYASSVLRHLRCPHDTSRPQSLIRVSTGYGGAQIQ